MKGGFIFLFLATTITLGLTDPDRLITESIAENNVHVIRKDSICETPACVHSASFILKNMDSSVDPCENFYRFACGKFVEETSIPDDKNAVTTYTMLKDKIHEQLRLKISDEIEEDDPHVVKTVKSYYQMCMDTDQIEKTSENDLRKILKNQGGCPVIEGLSWDEEHFDWKRSVHKAYKMGYDTDRFVSMSVRTDPNNSTRLMITIDEGITELPRDYLINGTNNDMVKNYMKAMIGSFEILGADKKQAEEEVNAVMDFEFQLAEIFISKEERRDQFKLNNRMTLHELEVIYAGIPWTEYLNEILAPYAHLDRNEEVIVAVPNFLESLPKLLDKTPKRVLANYLCFRTISDSIDYLGKDFLNMKAEVNEGVSGVGKQLPRWKKCLQLVSEDFSPALGQLYVRNYFDKNAKTDVVHLTKNLRNGLHHLIKQADWMDKTTKIAALEKLQSLVAHVGYPNELENDEKINEFYRDVTLHHGKFLRSEIALKKFHKMVKYSNLRKPADTLEWLGLSTVAVVNAFYYPSRNIFDLPAGILQGHFYNYDRPSYMNYGAAGSVVGHELSHAFDDEGSQYDKNGNLINWWGNETIKEYLKKAKCVIEQYGNYTVEEVNMKINGVNTQGENIADIVGLKAAYFAYNKWATKNSKESRLPGLHYTPQQMFWISYANIECRKIRPKKLKIDIISNPHAYAEFRVIGPVSNLFEFSKDFKCLLGSPMNPDKKCSIW